MGTTRGSGRHIDESCFPQAGLQRTPLMPTSIITMEKESNNGLHMSVYIKRLYHIAGNIGGELNLADW